MPRIARVIAEDYPHHIVQCGNRCQQVFFNENDYKEYLNFLEVNSKKYNAGAFLDKLGKLLNRDLKRKKPGPKKEKREGGN